MLLVIIYLKAMLSSKTNIYNNLTNIILILPVPNLDRTNNAIPRTSIKTTSSFKSTVQRSITQTRNGKPVTYAARQSAEATFVNGELHSGNVDYQVRNDNDTLDLLKNQERELEILMKNHRLDDEKFIEVGIEGVDDMDDIGVGDHGRTVMKAIENGNVEKRNGFKKSVENINAGSTPIKKTVSRFIMFYF